jgi:quinolinate synthase
MHVWMGECHVHAGISPEEMQARAAAEPDAELFIHPECGCSTQAVWLLGEGVLPAERTKILSTGGMVAEAARSSATKFLVATETGILHQLRKANPSKTFEAINEDAVCRFMKTITPAALLRSLREGVFEITVPEDVRVRAERAVERMIAIGASPLAAAGSTAA